MPGKKTTLSDLSAYTGLSVTTISRVLNNKSEEYRISKASQEKVREAARKLEFRPNYAAQSLRRNLFHTIGLLVPKIDNPFFANIASIVIREADKYTFPVMLIDTGENPVEEENALEMLLSRNVDGIIAAPSSETPDKFLKMSEHMPVVLIDRYFEDTNLTYVATDNYKGAYDATKLLIGAGHQDVLCLQGAPLSITSRKRVQGYSDAMTEAGLADKIVISGNEYSVQSGYIETRLRLMSKKSPTAILACSSTIMLGAMKAINENGLTIPDDISIISFDNNVFLDYLNPPITRIAQPIEHIGMVATKLLIDSILGTEEWKPGIILPPEIIPGASIKHL